MSGVLLLSCLCAGLLTSQARAFAVHQGCYKTFDADARAFPFKAAAANDMTVEACRCVSVGGLGETIQPCCTSADITGLSVLIDLT